MSVLLEESVRSVAVLEYDRGIMLPEDQWPRALKAAESDLEVVQDLLKAALRAEGYGSVKTVQRALGVSDGYLRRQRSLQRLELGVLFKILRILEIPVEVFLGPLQEQGSARARFLRRSEEIDEIPEVADAKRRFEAESGE